MSTRKLSKRLKSEDDASALRLHKSAFVFDGHSDTPCDVIKRRALGETAVLKNHFVDKWRKGGVDGLLMSTTAPLLHYPTFEGNYLQAGLNFLDAFDKEAEESGSVVALATSVEDMEKAQNRGKIALVLGLEGGEPLEHNLGNLRLFQKLGLRVLQLVWNYRNAICDGAAEPSNGGLSKFGFDVVEECDRLGIVIDLAHSAPRTLSDVVSTSKRPVIVSHTACREILNHPRNITDDELVAVAEKRGTVGIAFYPRFLKGEGQPTLDDLLNHIEHAVDTVGAKHVGLGPDFIDYCLDRMLPSLQRVRIPGYAADAADYPKDAEDVTKLPNVTSGLMARGFSETEIKEILGGSFLRVYRSVWGK